MKKFVSRSLSAVLTLAALYLIFANVALNLPATREYLNDIEPDRFAVSWERAWSIYPLRFELMSIASDGQTPSEQWQLDAARAGVSVSLLPLLRGEVRVHDLELADVDLRLRPRPGPEDDYGDLAEFFPVIRNRDPDAPAELLREDDEGRLVLEVDDIHLKGEHTFWVSDIRGNLLGEVRGSFRMDAGAGPMSLVGGVLDLALTSLKVGSAEPVRNDATIRGEVEIPPFTLSETEGLEFLRLGELDVRVDLPVHDLDFLTFLVPPAGALDLRGRGRLRGRVELSAGEVLRGTDLRVDTHELAMTLGVYHFSGDGSVEFQVDPADEAQADLIVSFEQVQARLEPDGTTDAAGPLALFSGHGLTAKMHMAETDPTTTSSAVKAEELLSEVELGLLLTIPSMEVADLAVYNRLLPDKWGLRLLGGTGSVSGRLAIASNALSLDLDLSSDDAELRYQDYHAITDLQLGLRGRVDEAAGATLHLDGTSLVIEDAEVAAAGRAPHSKPWKAEFTIGNGALTLPAPASGAHEDPISSVAGILQEQGFGALLGGADGRLAATLSVSRLDWIAELLNRPLGLTLTGSGALETEVVLADGWPARGTVLTVPRQALSLALMDHQVDGQGHASLRVLRGGTHPRLRLDLGLAHGRMRRQDETKASIDEVRMDATILVSDPLAGSGGTSDVSLAIHSARVRDMSTYNAYLPAHAPLSLIAGEASLVGDFHFTPDGAKGELLLLAAGIRVALEEEQLSGDLRLDLLLRDGSAEDMRFDITGSSVVLDGFRVSGAAGSAPAPGWRARLQLEETEVLWQKPMHLDMTAGVTVKDTRPFVALLDNARGEHGWIDDLLTVEDLGGHLRLILDGRRAILSDAMIGSERITVGAKGQADAHTREGIVYVRWENLTGALELQGEERRFHITDARGRFDAYVPGQTALGSIPAHGEKPPPDSAGAESPWKAAAQGRAGGVVPAGQDPRSSHRIDKAAEEPENPFLNEDL